MLTALDPDGAADRLMALFAAADLPAARGGELLALLAGDTDKGPPQDA